MKKVCHDNQTLDSSNAEYVVLQTGSMSSNNKPIVTKIDNLSLLLQESDSVTNFRLYLDSINSGHFLDFWFACQGFKNFDRSDTHKLHQLTKVIYRAYIRSESPYAVPLKQNTKKSIVDKLSDRKCFDQSIFDTAQLEIRDILSGEFLMNFLQSDFYIEPKSFERNLLSNSSRIQEQISDIPVSSCSSSGHIGRKSSSARINAIASRGSEGVNDGNCNKGSTDNSFGQLYTAQNTGTITTVFNNNLMGNNGSGTGSKDRRNLSEIDPQAFAKLLYTKLEEIVEEQMKFEKILRLVKSVPTESDTDDSSSSAISYLMHCQWVHSQGANFKNSVDSELVEAANALTMKASCKLKTTYRPGDLRDDHAQDILENHCLRIGLDEPATRHLKRELSDGKNRWRREHDLGSITSYDSGVATSLEQYSNLGIPGSILENVPWQKSNFKSLNLNEIGIDNSPSSHRYHHHHHHHHHKNHFPLPKNQIVMESTDASGFSYFKDSPTKKNNISEVSSNFDSGVSSAYENMGRRFQPMNDKVSNWMCKNSNITSTGPYNFHEYDSNNASGIPPNTPLISARGGFTSPSFCDIYPNQIYMLPKPIKQVNLYSPVPECDSIPHQSLESWLEQQATVSASALIGKTLKMNNTNLQKPCFCTNTAGINDLGFIAPEISEPCDNRDQAANDPKLNLTNKDSQITKTNTSSKSNSLVVGYYIGNDPVPYRTQIPDSQYITLGQFKSLVAKKGPFRYFFKRYCDEFDCGVVHEEIIRDDAILPLWEGKVVAKIEKAE
uniref:Axis inhibition protein B n=1 Tax=Schmidtea mediterranea TaxID=79327 RepID=G3C7W9_SCHMD|nr:axis inhibition protein B [Schmidtea mediterranea]